MVRWFEPLDDGGPGCGYVVITAPDSYIIKGRMQLHRYEDDEDALFDFVAVHAADVFEGTEDADEAYST